MSSHVFFGFLSGLAACQHVVRRPVMARVVRILIARNSRDFAPICRIWAEAGRDHAGVILIWTLSHLQYGEIIRGVERWLAQIPSAAAWHGTIVSL